MSYPEARVFRPRSETENNLIDKMMQIRSKQRAIQRPSWTQYVSYLINKDVAEVRSQHKQRTR